MIIVLKQNTKPEQLENLEAWIHSMGIETHVSIGKTHTIIGLVGDTSQVDMDLVRALDIVENVKRIQEPFKNANRKFHNEDLVVDIGGGTADIAVISLGGVVESASIKVAGDDFDEALVRYMRKKHNLLIGERTAEEIKINIGSAYRRPEVLTMEVRGRNLVTGLPKTIVVTSEETLEALREPAMQIVDAVHNVLERTPPELAADIFDRGIVMTGGGSLLWGFDKLIESHTGIETHVAEDAISCVAYGTGKSLDSLDQMQDGTMNLSRRKQMNY
mgnify:CR=1 FL=1